MIDSILATGLQGIQSGLNRADQAAQDITRATTTDRERPEGLNLSSLTEAAVDLTVAEQQVAASVAVIRTADEMIGNLIDTKA